MFPIPSVKEELMMLCVPNSIIYSASEFRQTVYAELTKELASEKQLLDQVAATAANRPEALLLACDTSCVPKEVVEQKRRLLQEGVAQAAQQKLQTCEAKVSDLNARIARMRSDVEAEKARKGEDAEIRAVLGDVEGFDSGMFERRIAQDEEAAEEVTPELEAMRQTADKLDKLGKLAANPAMEQRLCSNYRFARVAEARVTLEQWRAVEEKRAALQSSIDAALACEQECFVLRSLLLEDHSQREISRVCGMQLNRVKERLPAIHTLYRDLYECFNGFERVYLPLVEVIQADNFVSKNSVFIQRLMEFPEMEAKVNEAYEEILPSVAMAEESVAKNEASLNKALLYRRRQREEYERKLKTIRICPCCNAMNDAKARNCNTCGGLLRSLWCVCWEYGIWEWGDVGCEGVNENRGCLGEYSGVWVKRCCEKDVEKRWSVNQLMDHPFVKKSIANILSYENSTILYKMAQDVLQQQKLSATPKEPHHSDDHQANDGDKKEASCSVNAELDTIIHAA